MKKISLYLLIFTMLYCLCACGKNSDAKSNSREDDGRKEQKIIISSIQVASNTRLCVQRCSFRTQNLWKEQIIG